MDACFGYVVSLSKLLIVPILAAVSSAHFHAKCHCISRLKPGNVQIACLALYKIVRAKDLSVSRTNAQSGTTRTLTYNTFTEVRTSNDELCQHLCAHRNPSDRQHRVLTRDTSGPG
jgi:hypothetical protein